MGAGERVSGIRRLLAAAIICSRLCTSTYRTYARAFVIHAAVRQSENRRMKIGIDEAQKQNASLLLGEAPADGDAHVLQLAIIVIKVPS